LTLTLEQAPVPDSYEEQPPDAQYTPALAYEVYGPANGYWRHDPNQVPVWLRDYHDYVSGVAHNYDTPATGQEIPKSASTSIHTVRIEEMGPDTEKFNAFWYSETDCPQSIHTATMTAPDMASEPQNRTAHGRHRRKPPPTLKPPTTLR